MEDYIPERMPYTGELPDDLTNVRVITVVYYIAPSGDYTNMKAFVDEEKAIKYYLDLASSVAGKKFTAFSEVEPFFEDKIAEGFHPGIIMFEKVVLDTSNTTENEKETQNSNLNKEEESKWNL